MTEHACLNHYEEKSASLWNRNHRQTGAGHRNLRYFGLCSSVCANERGLSRCQFSIEENIGRIMGLCDWRLTRRNLLVVVFTVSQREILMTTARVNASGVEMHHYYYDRLEPVSTMVERISGNWANKGECYIFMPGRSEIQMHTFDRSANQFSVSEFCASIPGSCVVRLDLLTRFLNSPRRIGADARYWLEESGLGVSSLYRQSLAETECTDISLMTAISYSDLAALVRLIVNPAQPT